MHNVRMVSIASLSMGSLSSAGNSVLAVWVMVHLPRYAASSGPQGQLPSTERYRYRQSAERLPSGLKGRSSQRDSVAQQQVATYGMLSTAADSRAEPRARNHRMGRVGR